MDDLSIARGYVNAYLSIFGRVSGCPCRDGLRANRGATSGKRCAANYTKCTADNKATPEGQMIGTRMWKSDGTDTAVKLSDPKPLGRVDGFDQDEAESKRDERAVILRRLLAQL